MRAEMLLYHGQDATGMIEISTTSNTGPWTEIRLTSTQCVADALAEWQALAEAALPVGWAFAIEGNGVVINMGTDSAAWVQFGPCLQWLLGSTVAVVDPGAGWQSDAQVLGIVSQPSSDAYGRPMGFAAGTTFPTDVEDAELTDYRGARASVMHYGRAVEVMVDLIVPPDLWSLAEDSPILGGHAAFKLVIENEDPFGEDDLDGYLVCYPLEEVERERLSDDDPCWIRLRCTTGDP